MTNTENKVAFREKVGFSLVNLGNIPIMTLLNTYLLIFYTDVVDIPPAKVAFLFLVSRIMDGISDPILGFLIDRFPNTRYGKYRPLIMIGTTICCLNYLLVWFAPLFTDNAKMVAVWITYLLLGISFDLMDIPLNSILPVLTDRENERNIFSSIKGISYTIGQALINIIAPIILLSFSTQKKGFEVLIIGATAIVWLFSVVGASCLKERRLDIKNSENYKLKDLFKILTVRPVFVLFISMLLVTTAICIFNGSVMYYAIYVLGNAKYFSYASIIGLIGAITAGILVPFISKKIGKTNLYIFGMVLVACMMALIFIFNRNMVIFYLSFLMIQCGLGFINTIQYSLSADNVDYILDHMGINSAAAIAALNSLIMKFAMAVGGALPGIILSYTGYIANQNQSVFALEGIKIATFLFPVVIYLLSAILFKVGYRTVNKNTSVELVNREL